MELLVTIIFITITALFSISAFYVANEKEEKDEKRTKRTKGKRR